MKNMKSETWGYSLEEKMPEIGEYFHFKLKRCPDPEGAFSCCGVGKKAALGQFKVALKPKDKYLAGR